LNLKNGLNVFFLANQRREKKFNKQLNFERHQNNKIRTYPETM